MASSAPNRLIKAFLIIACPIVLLEQYLGSLYCNPWTITATTTTTTTTTFTSLDAKFVAPRETDGHLREGGTSGRESIGSILPVDAGSSDNQSLKLTGMDASGKYNTSTIRRDPNHLIPLDQLLGRLDENNRHNCSGNLIPVADKHLPYKQLFSGNLKIPRIVHQTCKSRCVTTTFFQLIEDWKLGDDWATYFHSDEAVDRLFRQDWPEFPHLSFVLKCIQGKGTLKADLWRYLILWEYGGIYADLDTKPNIFNTTTITADDDAFFVVEHYHLLSQYFMAASPRHPIMFYTIHHVLSELLYALDIGFLQRRAPLITGPHALHRGFQSFMADQGVTVPDPDEGPAKAGVWVGTDHRSITVVGRAEHDNEYVQRESMKRKVKHKNYNEMGMVHFTKGDRSATNMSCMHTLLDAHLYKFKDPYHQIR